jgi:hypothetical protein
MANKKIDWQKISVYIAALVGFLTILFYLIEMKVDIGKLQVEVVNIKEKIK